MREMMSLLDDANRLQTQIDTVFAEAYASLQKANINLGICDRIAEAVEVDDSLEIRTAPSWGVEIPIFRASAPTRLEYGFYSSDSSLDECYSTSEGEGADPAAGGDRKRHLPAGQRHQKDPEAGQRPPQYRHPRL